MSNILSKIKTECSTFIKECDGQYAHKALVFDGRFVKKVKVRKKKNKESFMDLFDKAFEVEYRDIMGRSIFCNGIHAESDEYEREEFYVFPINGYKFLYNPEVDYYKEYMKIYFNLKDNMDIDEAKNTFIDLIEYSYKNNDADLSDSLFASNEIMFYGIPYYYAVKKSKHPDYAQLLKMILRE